LKIGTVERIFWYVGKTSSTTHACTPSLSSNLTRFPKSNLPMNQIYY